MKKLNGMKRDFSSLENKKLANTRSIIGGGATNEKSTCETGPNGQPGNTGDTVICVDGKQVAVLTID
ncbi:grasp-with-spasm system A modified peptide [Chryseobacterium viscerum]|uniref:Grasp-with-spasm system A modified peptide n=1 Tax=Chryseobacterium viscerum TaxID=1037377 RepID=A0A316WGM2_9FLAO|nr:grasp-with-spasm system A modified peptide [Chryseobacterium viscerum]PWN60289.1 grasp-with-spasm system A modified peptide [Chryseobacterium viscerum]